MNISLVLPTEEYKEKIMEYKAIFMENGDSMDGTAGLAQCVTFEEWYFNYKNQRRKGITTKMLSLALIECKKLNILKILITCDKENIASAKTIIKNKGILENEVLKNDRITERYWITIL